MVRVGAALATAVLRLLALLPVEVSVDGQHVIGAEVESASDVARV